MIRIKFEFIYSINSATGSSIKKANKKVQIKELWAYEGFVFGTEYWIALSLRTIKGVSAIVICTSKWWRFFIIIWKTIIYVLENNLDYNRRYFYFWNTVIWRIMTFTSFCINSTLIDCNKRKHSIGATECRLNLAYISISCRMLASENWREMVTKRGRSCCRIEYTKAKENMQMQGMHYGMQINNNNRRGSNNSLTCINSLLLRFILMHRRINI